MAQHAYYTTEKLAMIKNEAILKQADARLWELKGALARDFRVESKAAEFDRIMAEAEMRGLI